MDTVEEEDAICRGDEKDAANLLSGLGEEDRKAEKLRSNGRGNVFSLPCAWTGDSHVVWASTRFERGVTFSRGWT